MKGQERCGNFGQGKNPDGGFWLQGRSRLKIRRDHQQKGLWHRQRKGPMRTGLREKKKKRCGEAPFKIIFKKRPPVSKKKRVKSQQLAQGKEILLREEERAVAAPPQAQH